MLIISDLVASRGRFVTDNHLENLAVKAQETQTQRKFLQHTYTHPLVMALHSSEHTTNPKS